MGSQEVSSRGKCFQLESAAPIGDRKRGGRAQRRDERATDRRTAFILNDALYGTGSHSRHAGERTRNRAGTLGASIL